MKFKDLFKSDFERRMDRLPEAVRQFYKSHSSEIQCSSAEDYYLLCRISNLTFMVLKDPDSPDLLLRFGSYNPYQSLMEWSITPDESLDPVIDMINSIESDDLNSIDDLIKIGKRGAIRPKMVLYTSKLPSWSDVGRGIFKVDKLLYVFTDGENVTGDDMDKLSQYFKFYE